MLVAPRAAAGAGASSRPRVPAVNANPGAATQPASGISSRVTLRGATSGRVVRDVRAGAWLGQWLQQNDNESSKKPPTKPRNQDRRGRRQQPNQRATQQRKAPQMPPADDIRPEELRPDFDLRRDLYDLYNVVSLDDEVGRCNTLLGG